MSLEFAPVAGRVYHAPGAYLTLLAAANTAYAVPFEAPRRGLTFDQIGVRVTTAGVGAGADVRFAIYEDENGVPGKLVQDFAAVTALTSTGAFKVDLSGVTMPRLWGAHPYWLVTVFGTAATTQPTVAAVGATAVSQELSARLGAATIAALPNAATAGSTGLTATLAYGAFPDFGTTLTWSVVSTAMPLVGMRAV